MILVKLQVLTRTTGITPCPSFEVSIILFPYLQSPRVLSLSMAVSVFDRTGYVVPTFRQFPQFGITGLVNLSDSWKLRKTSIYTIIHIFSLYVSCHFLKIQYKEFYDIGVVNQYTIQYQQ